jgi:hypothetical protein
MDCVNEHWRDIQVRTGDKMIEKLHMKYLFEFAPFLSANVTFGKKKVVEIKSMEKIII